MEKMLFNRKKAKSSGSYKTAIIIPRHGLPLITTVCDIIPKNYSLLYKGNCIFEVNRFLNHKIPCHIAKLYEKFTFYKKFLLFNTIWLLFSSIKHLNL